MNEPVTLCFGGGARWPRLGSFFISSLPKNMKSAFSHENHILLLRPLRLAIPTELVDDVKGLNIRVDLDHGAYESFVFQHACLSCRSSVRTVLVEWRDKHKKAAQT